MTDTTEITRKRGYAIVGYPGAGKSAAGRIAAETFDAVYLETGDIVRESFNRDSARTADSVPSKVLGHYSTQRRRIDGGDYVAQEVIRVLEQEPDAVLTDVGAERFPDSPVVVAGMRDTESPELFNEYFDSFQIIWIHAPFDVRLERLQDRGRQDEGDFTEEDLKWRDGRENMWGTGDVAFESDVRISNTGTLDDLRDALEAEVRV